MVITNAAGRVTSSNALLTVIAPPTLALELSAGYPLLSLRGVLSSNFVVQYSPDVAQTNWIQLLSLTNLSASPYQFLDPLPPKAGEILLEIVVRRYGNEFSIRQIHIGSLALLNRLPSPKWLAWLTFHQRLRTLSTTST